jgi:hypothetical protein
VGRAVSFRRSAAARLGLAGEVRELAALVERRDFPRLVTALVRTSLAKDYEEIVASARSSCR